MLNPELSSVSQPGYQLGTTAAGILIDRVNGDLSPAKQVVLKTAVQLRHSVVPVQEEEQSVTRGKKERVAR
ncbi:MAG TPA: substrate-binding domain-containing protein, partial [Edaphobacter sp.]|jgi:LacI family transcriptional regulator